MCGAAYKAFFWFFIFFHFFSIISYFMTSLIKIWFYFILLAKLTVWVLLNLKKHFKGSFWLCSRDSGEIRLEKMPIFGFVTAFTNHPIRWQHGYQYFSDTNITQKNWICYQNSTTKCQKKVIAKKHLKGGEITQKSRTVN